MDVIVPVKSFHLAKQRLASALDGAARAQLARSMSRRVIRALMQSECVGTVHVVSMEPEMRDFCDDLGAVLLPDSGYGLNAALASAIGAVTWEKDVAIVHADLPLFTTIEFDRIASRHLDGASRRLTLVRDHTGSGTNLTFLRPPRCVPPLFGPESAARHAAAARAAGCDVLIVESVPLSLDCDRPDDLNGLLQGSHGKLLDRSFKEVMS